MEQDILCLLHLHDSTHTARFHPSDQALSPSGSVSAHASMAHGTLLPCLALPQSPGRHTVPFLSPLSWE
jgi:hypothetical protein